MEPKARIEATERNVAIIVDVCTQAFRLQDAVNDVVKLPWKDKYELARRTGQVQEALRALEIVRNRLPQFETAGPKAVIREAREKIEDRLSAAEYHRRKQLAADVAGAKTPLEQQRILQAAGIVKPR